MSYSVNKITTVVDCDLLLDWAVNEKSTLNLKKLNEQSAANHYGSSSLQIDAELQGVNAELSASETIIAALPDGKSKVEAIKKRTRQEYRKFLLVNRKESYGVVALLEKELDLANLDLELNEVDTFIAAVNTRKAAL